VVKCRTFCPPNNDQAIVARNFVECVQDLQGYFQLAMFCTFVDEFMFYEYEYFLRMYMLFKDCH
jgi:hypothetical protein